MRKQRRGTLGRHAPVIVCTTLLAVLSTACGITGEAAPVEGPAHPFTVGEVPSRYVLTAAGRGTEDPGLSQESSGAEPFTVVEVDGERIVASPTSWDWDVGDISEASASGDPDPETMTLADGRQALHGEGTDGAWSDLVLEFSQGEGLRIASPGADRDALVAAAAHFQPRGRTDAPEVVSPPDGWKVVGSVGSDVVVAMHAETRDQFNQVPGPASGYAIGWLDTREPEQLTSLGTLAVTVLAGDALDLDALLAARPTREDGRPPEELKVEGRRAVFLERSAAYGGGLRSLVTHDETGALVLVSAVGEALPTRAELVAVAASVDPVDQDAWTEFLVDLFGGSTLEADAGEQELDRGEVDGVEWILQTSTWPPTDPTRSTEPGGAPSDDRHTGLDTCLKVSTQLRACATGGGGEEGTVAAWASDDPDFSRVGLPEFLLISANVDAVTQVRVTVGDQIVETELIPLPHGQHSPRAVAVVFADLPDGTHHVPTCTREPTPGAVLVDPIRVRWLDSSGSPVGCEGY